MMNIEFIAQYAGQAIQLMLIFVLFWVAFLFMRLDKKLTQMRKGTDGIQATIVELNRAVNNAQSALQELKIGSGEQIIELNDKIVEAQKMAEGLKFLNSVQKNLKPTSNGYGLNAHNPNGVEPKGMPPLENDYLEQEYINREPVRSQYIDERSQPQYARRKVQNRVQNTGASGNYNDLPPVDTSRRNQWGGLR